MGKRTEAREVTDGELRRQERLRQLVKRERTQKAFAIKHGISEKFLSQMLRSPEKADWRAVGNATVRKLEKDQILKLGKGYFDAAEIIEQPSAGLLESRSKNNVKALRFAMQSLFSVLHGQQPDIAEAVAQDILVTAGTEFVAGQLFLRTLVGILRGEPHMSEEAPPDTRQSPTSKASKRAVSVAK
jgi:hypothetical protein